MCDGFDIFRKTSGIGLLWIASASSLEEANEYIKSTLSGVPGEYVVFCQATQEVVAVETIRSATSTKGAP